MWTLEKIRQEVRSLTGRKSESQMTTAQLDDYINEYYTLQMPLDLDLEESQEFWTGETADGVDNVPLDAEVLIIKPPLTVAGYPMELVDEPVRFYALYPKSGEPYTENRPDTALYYGRVLILRPPPDGIYQLHAPCLTIPYVLTAGQGPNRDAWGRLLCLGTSILIFGSKGEREAVERLQPAYDGQRALVQRPYLKRMAGFRGQPRF